MKISVVIVAFLCLGRLSFGQGEPIRVSAPFVSRTFEGVSTLDCERTAVGSSRSSGCVIRFDAEGRLRMPGDEEGEFSLSWDEKTLQWIGQVEGAKVSVKAIWYGPVLQFVYDSVGGKGDFRIFVNVVEVKRRDGGG